jgi:hypothetical protein
VRDLEERKRQLQQRLAQVVVLDPDKKAEFACVGQAMDVSLPEWPREKVSASAAWPSRSAFSFWAKL